MSTTDTITTELRALLNRAILCAHRGGEWDGAEALSTVLDHGWDAADHVGDTRLARRCERAYREVTA